MVVLMSDERDKERRLGLRRHSNEYGAAAVVTTHHEDGVLLWYDLQHLFTNVSLTAIDPVGPSLSHLR